MANPKSGLVMKTKKSCTGFWPVQLKLKRNWRIPI
jgi:hypothetical protein